MSTDARAVDYMLRAWAYYHLKEFTREVGYASKSVTARACEAYETGILSHGTKHLEIDYSVPAVVSSVSEALSQLTQGQQLVIKVEYTGKGNAKAKARMLQMTYGQYRARLFRARNKLIGLL